MIPTLPAAAVRPLAALALALALAGAFAIAAIAQGAPDPAATALHTTTFEDGTAVGITIPAGDLPRDQSFAANATITLPEGVSTSAVRLSFSAQARGGGAPWPIARRTFVHDERFSPAKTGTIKIGPIMIPGGSPGLHSLNISISSHRQSGDILRIPVGFTHPTSSQEFEYLNPANIVRIVADYENSQWTYHLVGNKKRVRAMTRDERLQGDHHREVGPEHHPAHGWTGYATD